MTKEREPTHPGAVLREDVLPALRRSVTKVAGDLGVTRQILHRIMAEEAPITPEMALRLGKYCGNGPDLWLAMQRRHDLWRATQALEKQLDRIPVAEVA